MPSTIGTFKIIGVLGLGLLTGTSYTLSTLSLPALLTLPSARPASYTLSQTTRLTTLHTRALSTISATSLFLAFYLSPSHLRHPYLLWTGAVAGLSGGLNLLMGARDKKAVAIEDVEDVNGEQVERRARSAQMVEFVRTGVAGLGFVMGVIGVWGDGA
ncbi:Autophagy-related protein 33 [Fulvia fulva]|nr:Autophagy-related protein 33 [Fulvia fulva]